MATWLTFLDRFSGKVFFLDDKWEKLSSLKLFTEPVVKWYLQFIAGNPGVASIDGTDRFLIFFKTFYWKLCAVLN